MKIASQRPIPTSARSPLPHREIHRPFGIKNLQIPLSRLSTHIDFYFMYFQVLTNPFSTNPFPSRSIQNPRVCTLPALCPPNSVPFVLHSCNGFVISSLPPLVFSLLSFSLSCRLFSIVYSLFAQNKGVGVPRQTVGQPFLPAGCSRGCPPWIHRSIRHHYQAAER